MLKRNPYKRHDKEYIQEAINLIKTGNKSVAEIGRELGVHSSTLYGWLKREKEDNVSKDSPSSHLNEKEELRRLQRELQDAKMERDILKKAVAVFSKHQR